MDEITKAILECMERVARKVANGEPLTKGEQAIADKLLPARFGRRK